MKKVVALVSLSKPFWLMNSGFLLLPKYRRVNAPYPWDNIKTSVRSNDLVDVVMLHNSQVDQIPRTQCWIFLCQFTSLLHISILNREDMPQHDTAKVIEHLKAFFPFPNVEVTIQDFLEDFRIRDCLQFATGDSPDHAL